MAVLKDAAGFQVGGDAGGAEGVAANPVGETGIPDPALIMRNTPTRFIGRKRYDIDTYRTDGACPVRCRRATGQSCIDAGRAGFQVQSIVRRHPSAIRPGRMGGIHKLGVNIDIAAAIDAKGGIPTGSTPAAILNAAMAENSNTAL